MKAKTLFDKIWDSHVVSSIPDGPDVLYIDKHLIHEVTSPQAFTGLEQRNLPVFRPDQIVATADHNVPTQNQHLPIQDKLSRLQVQTLTDNCKTHNIELYDLNHPYNGIVHVIGPELGLTQPGMTIVCGDSHTSTHGAFGNIAFGIGTSEVEMVMASQCVLQAKPKKMRITIDGNLAKAVSSKDIILYIISKISASGGTGYFIEFSGSAITGLSMESRMTICNMSIEMGARGGLIAPDKTTFEYLKGKEFSPKAESWYQSLAKWKQLQTDKNALFDKEWDFNAEDIRPMITFGTNPGMAMSIVDSIPQLNSISKESRDSFQKSLDYMGFEAGSELKGKKMDYVFVGSCTNGRIEDIRAFSKLVKGRKKADWITAWIVPGSKKVEKQAKEEGLESILNEAGFELRQPGCSACLAMNDDKIPEGKYSVSTSNRNFEGRQGPGARTLLASPLTAAAAAVTGRITNPGDLM